MMSQAMRAALVAATVFSVSGCSRQDEPAKPSAPAAARPNPSGCNSDLSQLIQADYALTRKCSPYTASRGLQVDGYTLTIEPGVEVRFGEGASLEVGYQKAGRLLARGSPDAPVRFVSAGRKEPGFWKSVALYDHSAGSVLDNVLIEHAGTGDKAALTVFGDDIRLTRLKVVAAKGASIEQRDFDKARITELAGSDFTEAGPAEAPLSLNVNSLGALAGDNRFAPGSVIKVSGRVERDLKVPNLGVPYRVDQDLDIEGLEGVPASLTLDPGTVFQMGEGTAINCGYSQNAALRAVGTAEQPIIFTRYGDTTKGSSWKGLQFFSRCRPPVLEHVKLAHGSRTGALLQHTDSKGLGTLRHCTLAHSAGSGLKVSGTKERFEAFDDNTFEDLGPVAVSMPVEYAHLLGGHNVFPAGSVIELEGDVRRDTSLAALLVPYEVRGGVNVAAIDDAKPATLTLLPGVTLKFATDLRLNVAYSRPGALVAVGTEAAPIVLTAAIESWRGLMLYEKAHADLQHVVIEKVSGDYPGAEARGAQGTMKNVTFRKMKVGLRRCGDKLTATGLVSDNVLAAESKDGC
jgi:hypothetical protein